LKTGFRTAWEYVVAAYHGQYPVLAARTSY